MIRKFLLPLCALFLFSSLPLISSAQVLKPDLMYCGGSSAKGADLYLGVGTFNEITGCLPDGDTQAILVSRSGSIGGNGAAWLAYLDADGVIITDWRNAHLVYNEIYGSTYPIGTSFGDCRDNAMPSEKLNTDHPFWVDNTGLMETPSDFEGCGADISAIVAGEDEVTALGGLVGTSNISFAIRPQGLGVFWLLDADWQDNESNYFSDDSKNFMGSLISGGTYGSALEDVPPVPTLSTIGMLLLILAFAYIGVRRRSWT